MKKTNIFLSFIAIATLVVALAGCTKPKDGAEGAAGKDANETCKLCHNASVVDAVAVQYDLSKHSWGEASFAEAGNTGCAPCHESEGFKYVCANNTPATFTLSTTTNKYVNDYASVSTAAYGEISCFTCHNKLHTTYGSTDLPALTTVAPVSMTFFGGTKSINLTQDGGISNLCVKCHQPRPFTASGQNGRLLNYDSLKNFPTDVFFDTTLTTNRLKPGYRTHTHYGTIGAIYAGVGFAGIEFPGTLSYTNSKHTTETSCQDCHMATVSGAAGGHTFKAEGNLNGCNVTDCHGAGTVTTSATDPYLGAVKTEIKGLLGQLAAKLQQGGREIMNRNADATTNLWYGHTTNNYDGYLNIYDPINNPTGSTTSFKANSTSGFSAAQIAFNNTLPKLMLTNAQFGSIINFQMCLREYSLGIHNYKYTKALLTNSIAILP